MRIVPVARRHLMALLTMYVTLIAGFVGHLARDLSASGRIVSADFTVYYAAWTQITSGAGRTLYEPAAQAAMQQRVIWPAVFPGGLLAFINPPHFAFAFAPFAHLPLATSFRVWTALQGLLAFLIVRSVLALVGTSAPINRWIVAAAILAFWPLFYAIQLGQTSLLLTLSLLRLYAAVERREHAWGGFWLFVLSIKPQLLPLVLVFLVAHRRWRLLASAAAFGVASFAVTSVGLGWTIWRTYLVNLPRLEAFFAQGTVPYMVTLRGLLALVFGTPPPGSRGAFTQAVLTYGALAIAMITMTRVWTRKRSAHASSPSLPSVDHRFALALALGLLLCPHLFLQDVTLWIVPLAAFYRSLDAQHARQLAGFALAWPALFVGVGAFTTQTGRSATAAALVPLVIAAAWIVSSPPAVARLQTAP
jgi:hypothetical protein